MKYYYYIVPLLVFGLLYIIFSFIAWDLNPFHWWLFTNWLGRIIAVIIGILYIDAIIKYFSDEL